MIRFLLVLFLLSLRGFGATTYYVDSQWAGTHSGSASQPWRSVDWTAINTALASGNVTVYCTARLSSSDTEAIYSATGSLTTPDKIFCYSRTDTGSSTLTFNGRSFYNTSEVSPSWVAYGGTNKSNVKGFISQNDTHDKKSNITVDGFHVTNSGDEKGVSIAGDNWTLINCNIEGTSGGGNPTVLLVPTSDAAHEGSSAWTPACTNIVIRTNIIHKSSGESVYLGGGGKNAGESGSGYPSHDKVNVSENTVFDSGFWDGQGDGIDGKGGLTHLTIEHNTIYNVGLNGNGDASARSRAIVVQGLYNITSDVRQIIRNTIYGCTNIDDGAIALSDSWGVQKGTLIANNLIYNISLTGSTACGIKIYSTSGTITNANNTIYGCTGAAIIAASGSTVIVENNLMTVNNANGPQLDLGGIVTVSDYNAYLGSIGYGGEGPHTFSTTAIGNFTNPGVDFTLLSTAPAIGRATTFTIFSNDIIGATRTFPWDIGAYKYGGTVVGAPAQITGVVIITGGVTIQ